jgi:hypothetical protein
MRFRVTSAAACVLMLALALALAPAARAQAPCCCDAKCVADCSKGCACPDLARARAMAAMAFAKAVRESHEPHCLADLKVAAMIAARDHKPLLIWVGGCGDNTALRDGLPGAVNVHADEFNGNAEPRLILSTPDGPVYLRREDLRGHTPATIRAIMNPPAPAPAVYTPVLLQVQLPAAPVTVSFPASAGCST